MSDTPQVHAEKNLKENVYRVLFANMGQIYEVYVKDIYQSDLYGFIEVETYLFGNRSQLIVDPGEERLKTELSNVKRSYIPIHLILRIDEVEKEGVPKIADVAGTNVMSFPGVGPLPGFIPKKTT